MVIVLRTLLGLTVLFRRRCEAYVLTGFMSLVGLVCLRVDDGVSGYTMFADWFVCLFFGRRLFVSSSRIEKKLAPELGWKEFNSEVLISMLVSIYLQLRLQSLLVVNNQRQILVQCRER